MNLNNSKHRHDMFVNRRWRIHSHSTFEEMAKPESNFCNKKKTWKNDKKCRTKRTDQKAISIAQVDSKSSGIQKRKRKTKWKWKRRPLSPSPTDIHNMFVWWNGDWIDHLSQCNQSNEITWTKNQNEINIIPIPKMKEETKNSAGMVINNASGMVFCCNSDEERKRKIATTTIWSALCLDLICDMWIWLVCLTKIFIFYLHVFPFHISFHFFLFWFDWLLLWKKQRRRMGNGHKLMAIWSLLLYFSKKKVEFL